MDNKMLSIRSIEEDSVEANKVFHCRRSQSVSENLVQTRIQPWGTSHLRMTPKDRTSGCWKTGPFAMGCRAPPDTVRGTIRVEATGLALPNAAITIPIITGSNSTVTKFPLDQYRVAEGRMERTS